MTGQSGLPNISHTDAHTSSFPMVLKGFMLINSHKTKWLCKNISTKKCKWNKYFCKKSMFAGAPFRHPIVVFRILTDWMHFSTTFSYCMIFKPLPLKKCNISPSLNIYLYIFIYEKNIYTSAWKPLSLSFLGSPEPWSDLLLYIWTPGLTGTP